MNLSLIICQKNAKNYMHAHRDWSKNRESGCTPTQEGKREKMDDHKIAINES